MESFSLKELAREHERTRRMVASLVGSEQLGEDAVQDAWVKLLERSSSRGPHSSPRSLSAWLSVAARRFAWNERRRASRQHAREASSARDEALPSSVEIASRSEISRRVMATLEGLDEPHASILRDHYFGELSAAEIGRRDGLPAETVRSRIRRAREQLRARLEADGLGGDVHWSLAAAPFVLGVKSTSVVPIASVMGVPTTLLMKKLVASVAVIISVLGITFVYQHGSDRRVPSIGQHESGEAERLTRVTDQDDVVRTETEVDSPDGARRAIEDSYEQENENDAKYRLVGTVIDGDRRPIEGAAVRVGGRNEWPDANHRVSVWERSRSVGRVRNEF